MKTSFRIPASNLRISIALTMAMFLLMRTMPPFARVWAQAISVPVLQTLVCLGNLPAFSLLGCGSLIAAAMLLFAALRRRFMRCLAAMLAAFALAFTAIWYPLYFLHAPAYTANIRQMAASAELLIDRLNADAPADFLPDGLPGKAVTFPGWMRIAGISGFASFLTGEAFYDPSLPVCALPFVAVHEEMHLLGIADEGAANIAAWQQCMERGGAYAGSAPIWGLRYIMGALLQNSPGLYARCVNRMDEAVFRLYQDCGGAYLPSKQSAFLQPLFRFLGIDSGLQNYEILAAYLAANIPQ